MKKLKKLNKRRFSPSFTLIELLIVIVIIGILISFISFNLAPDKLNLAADNVIKNIRYTQSLALKDDKYYPFPLSNNEVEYNRSKYWFKQWWQIRFSTFNKDGKKHYYYEIFSDVPSNFSSKNFDGYGYYPVNERNNSIAKDPLNHKLLIGICNYDGSHYSYPSCEDINKNLDLTQTYGIKKVEKSRFRLIFDNYGNIFLREGDSGDAKDINPLDENNRTVLKSTAILRLCKDNPCIYNKERCIQINITPSGEIYKSECQY